MSAMAMPELLFYERWSGDQLCRDYPPRFTDANKALLYQLAGGAGADGDREIVVARVAPTPSAEVAWCYSPRLTCDPGFYRYPPVEDSGRVDWHVNFADAELFGFYSGALFAQDEMQVAEHPILASVREKLQVLAQRDARYAPRTCNDQGVPTPVLLSGVPRRISIAVCPDASSGRPDGLYGHHMARASRDVICRAVCRLEPVASSRILAMAAPSGGQGSYTRVQIASALQAAWSGFAAARSLGISDPGVDTVVIHTGNWGCGAFGGNSVLMLTVQMLAGLWAGIDELIFYDAEPVAWASALNHYRRLKPQNLTLEQVLDDLLAQGFHWGRSNGT